MFLNTYVNESTNDFRSIKMNTMDKYGGARHAPAAAMAHEGQSVSWSDPLG